MSTSRARQLRSNMTVAERRLWCRLRRRQLEGIRFRRQTPIGPYYVDFICLEEKLIIEIDGGQHAIEREADGARTQWLESKGYRVLRYWNNEVLEKTEAVVEDIRRAAMGALPPTPSTALPPPPPRS